MEVVRKLVIGMMVWFLSSSLYAQEFVREEIFQEASRQNKFVLMVFSGSDWCAPCIRFEKKVLSQSEFLTYSSRQLMVVKVDFPQKHVLTKELQAKSERLAEQYNPEGKFPHILLFKPNGSLVTVLHWKNESVYEFITQTNQLIIHEQPQGVQSEN